LVIDLPIAGPFMTKVGENNVAILVWLRHFLRIFTGLNNEFKPPKTVLGLAESAADCWSTRITEEPKVLREELVVDILRRIPQFP
jgi:hypothetical protein